MANVSAVWRKSGDACWWKGMPG